jgi:hypothetical protein
MTNPTSDGNEELSSGHKTNATNGTGFAAERIETSLDLFSETEDDLEFARQANELLIGQPKAKKMLARINRALRNKLRDKTRPIYKAILVGKSHVGKTETARALAQIYHNDPDAFVKVNCETFIDRSDLTRLIGAGPRWVGYDDPRNSKKDANQEDEFNSAALLSRVNLDLSKKGSKKNVVILLFDEIEKAEAPEFALLLLKILDTGKLRLANNVEVDFSDCIILMTSNEGMREFEEKARKTQFGFGTRGSAVQPGDLADHVDSAIRKRYPPEWLNRIDETVLYDQLSAEDLLGVVDLEIRRLEKRIKQTLGSKAFELHVDPSARQWLRDKALAAQGDAAELKRVFPRNLSDPLGEGVNRGEIRLGDEIHVEVAEDLNSLTFRRLRLAKAGEDIDPVVEEGDIWPTHHKRAYQLIQDSVQAKHGNDRIRAARCLEAAEAMLDRNREEDFPMLAGVLNQKGHLEYERKRWRPALALYSQALELRNKTLSQANWLSYIQIPYLFGNAANAMFQAGGKDDAKELCKYGLEVVKRLYVGKNDVDAVVTFLKNYMEVFPEEKENVLMFALQLGVPFRPES